MVTSGDGITTSDPNSAGFRDNLMRFYGPGVLVGSGMLATPWGFELLRSAPQDSSIAVVGAAAAGVIVVPVLGLLAQQIFYSLTTGRLAHAGWSRALDAVGALMPDGWDNERQQRVVWYYWLHVIAPGAERARNLYLWGLANSLGALLVAALIALLVSAVSWAVSQEWLWFFGAVTVGVLVSGLLLRQTSLAVQAAEDHDLAIIAANHESIGDTAHFLQRVNPDGWTGKRTWWEWPKEWVKGLFRKVDG